jgi:hypothetical protein
MSRERDILAAELRSSTAEFLGWLTGLKPPSDQEAIPVEMRPAFEKMCNRLALAAEQYAADRIEALEAALRFALEVMENYSKLDGRDPSYATPSSAIGVARSALAPECIHSWSAPFDGMVKCTKCGSVLAEEQDK